MSCRVSGRCSLRSTATLVPVPSRQPPETAVKSDRAGRRHVAHRCRVRRDWSRHSHHATHKRRHRQNARPFHSSCTRYNDNLSQFWSARKMRQLNSGFLWRFIIIFLITNSILSVFYQILMLLFQFAFWLFSHSCRCTMRTQRSASYPAWDGKWVVACWLRGESQVWRGGVSACCKARV